MQNLSLQHQLVDSVGAACFHYHAQLQTPDVWRVRIGVQIPHYPICPVSSASYPELASHFSTKLKRVVVKIIISLLYKACHVMGPDTQFCLYVCVKLNFLCFISWHRLDHDGYRCLRILHGAATDGREETWCAVLHPSHPRRWWVWLPLSDFYLPCCVQHLHCNL